MKNELTLTNLLNQTVAELTENGRIVGIFLALMVPVSGFFGWVAVAGGAASSIFDLSSTTNILALGGGLIAIGLAAFAFMIALTYWFYAALMAYESAPGFGRIWPWIGIYILASLGIGFGLILLIVPGVILVVRWAIALPLVIEGKIPAMDTFGESWERTSRYGWSIFGLLVILVIGMLILTGIVTGISTILGGQASIPGIILAALVDALNSAVFVAVSVAAWRLSTDKSDEVAEVFG
ncbi:glycerophosphoryl diester phosphodiesterase membrane domain-containing protein [Erythrobacter crassostreae]|uniref:Glycerophosphoryl diester phosphodiesterase membrane domain-containing protein n=1 Tax=Erythrobacter crassostreae TaxID=2828328 RepID=A0A9X1JMS9_9SPHN|nr:glycerophosphoryl diester phosphodiesterase membrane domain-containing protein [Erythrobacter crassostrea]MBV7259734.1 glycerophosphoryl diester phosphodiesterase membrane domain-containing protein [Erythrobacter crassostrea]